MVFRALPRRQSLKAAATRSLAAIAMVAAVSLGRDAPAWAQDAGGPAFAKCLACHAVGTGAANKNGPVLNGVAGKPAGSASGFAYSEAFRDAQAAGLVWTDENLDRYLTDPIAFMPGGHMAWAVPDAAERRAIIAYLKTLP